MIGLIIEKNTDSSKVLGLRLWLSLLLDQNQGFLRIVNGSEFSAKACDRRIACTSVKMLGKHGTSPEQTHSLQISPT